VKFYFKLTNIHELQMLWKDITTKKWFYWSIILIGPCGQIYAVHFLKHLSGIFKMVCWIWQIFIDAQINGPAEMLKKRSTNSNKMAHRVYFGRSTPLESKWVWTFNLQIFSNRVHKAKTISVCFWLAEHHDWPSWWQLNSLSCYCIQV